EGVDRDPLPMGVELRPLGDAMDVGGDRLAGERVELCPRPALWRVDLAGQAEVPALERDVRRRPGGEHREGGGEVLPRWGPAGRGPWTPRDRKRSLIAAALPHPPGGPRSRPAPPGKSPTVGDAEPVEHARSPDAIRPPPERRLPPSV